MKVSKLRRNQKKENRQKKSEIDSYIKDLERRVSELLHENSKLKDSVYSLTSDKERLESKVILMQQIMKGTISQDSFDLCKEELGHKSISSSNYQMDDFKSNPLSSANVLLLIVLFSFSLLLHNTASEPFDVRSTNRSSISDHHHPVKVQMEKNISPNVTIKIEKNDGTPSKTTKRVLRHEKTSTSRSAKRRKDETNTKQQTSSPLFDSQSVIPLITHWRPNTTYLLCHNVSQIVPPTERQPLPLSPSLISLLVPPEAMGTTNREKSLLEVTCQVMDVSFVPIR